MSNQDRLLSDESPKLCKVIDCNMRTLANGMCSKHYQRWKRTGTTNTKLEMHGMTNTREYEAWGEMIRRCTKPTHRFYNHYGGRGIKVCDRWKNSFSAFYEDMGPRPVGMSLDRIDNDGNYEPGNVEWRTAKQQNNNTSRNRFITYEGKTMTISEWADHTGIKYVTLYRRITQGWPLSKALVKGDKI